ncbi:MAG: tRNA (adenosine(37)-N6)-threonylcarbamoyltransferase complex transferase subunit TsaD [Bacteroidia bacterium]|nr:tRNA (adenosine(37)-N6)-threonylcarbamoyltransferase complex transferase subunit TsaD [Bacteroidia bacterium]MCZ2248252.1 tRNA (adenosine(37)-N6)-threonylcarbamoyltransferase complex transferase subunit TsaD [Bacteroidia bacterium]
MKNDSIIILAIESSCDDTAAAIIKDGKILANIVATQQIHEKYGGVVPELASRAHQQNIVPVVNEALSLAQVELQEITAIAYTQGPGLLGSLLVGSSFAKGLALALNKPLVNVHHMQAHILAHFIESESSIPQFPFLCLTVSGGHTQIVLLNDYFDFEILGETLDDAAGEAFDKSAKLLGLPYPGGPLIDKYAQHGNPHKYKFPKPQIANYDYSFSGLKTAILNFINREVQMQPDFVEKNIEDICASIQFTIINILLNKLEKAILQYQVKHIGLAGGVAANSELRKQVNLLGKKHNCKVYIPPFEYCTDNAAMIGMVGYLKFVRGKIGSQAQAATARMDFDLYHK